MKNKLSEALQAMDNVRFAYLFGSYADDSYDENSDVDVAVYLDVYDLESRLAVHHTLAKATGREVDMVCLNDTKNLYLLERILHDSLLLKDSEERAEYEVKTQHAIIDFKNFKRSIHAA